MNEMNYEKPKMKKVCLYGKERIAAGNCWSEAASTGKDEWYYDYNKGETGYLVFHTTGNCGGWANDIKIVPEDAEGGEAAAVALKEFLDANGSNNGQHIFLEHGITDDPSKVS